MQPWDNQSFWVGPLRDSDGQKDSTDVASAIRSGIIGQLGKDFKARWHKGVTAKYYSKDDLRRKIDVKDGRDYNACVILKFKDPKAFAFAKKKYSPIDKNGKARTMAIDEGLRKLYKEYFLYLEPAATKMTMELLAGAFLKLANDDH